MKITTKYSSHPTSGASRITAKCGGRQLTVAYDHALSATQNHATAAAVLASKMRLATEQQTWEGRHNGDKGYTFAGNLPADAYGVVAFEAFRLGGPESVIPYSYEVF